MKKKTKSMLSSLFKVQTKWLPIVLIVSLLGTFLLFMTINNVYTQTYDIERFNRAKETIRSPITIENEVETERKIWESVQSVEDRYTTNEEITEERVEYIKEIFEAIAKLEEEEEPDIDEDVTILLTTQEKIQRLKNVLSIEITESLSDEVFEALLMLEPQERDQAEELLIPPLRDTLNRGVRTENVQSAINDIKQIINYTSVNPELKQVLNELTSFAVTANSFFDHDETMKARREAEKNVEPVIIRAGEIIVREGQTITNEIYEELKLAGLLNNERNIYPVVGLVILIILLMAIVGYELKVYDDRKTLNRGKAIAILLISLLMIAFMKMISLYTTQINQLYVIVPIATGALLLKQLMRERIAIVMSIVYAIIGSIIFNGEIPGSLNFEAGIYFFFSQMAAIIFLMNVKDRLSIVKSGVWMALVNIVTVLAFIFLSFEKYEMMDIFLISSFAVVSALLSAVLTLGLLPFFETSLGILSDFKLLSLSSPNHPLLRKLLMEAPGTYHHSVMVANLSEAACEAIGANGLLARVGAYYHDIGKTVRPHYFIENQLAIKNPHDMIEPSESAHIIISHPYDGAALLKKHRLPKEIIAISEQHHGTSLLKYFYYKEKEKNENVLEKDFRYPGPKPQTKEAAIISICDSVEAAVRSLKEPTNEKISEIVASIISDKLMDGQLDESPLTLKELKAIQQTIHETLQGIFHSRIQYPKKEKNDDENNN